MMTDETFPRPVKVLLEEPHVAEDKFSRLDMGDLLFGLRVIRIFPSKRDVDEIRSDNGHDGRVIDLGDTFREHSSEGSLPFTLGGAYYLSSLSGVLGLLAVAMLILFVAFHALSVGSVFWLIVSEIFPLSVRGTAVGSVRSSSGSVTSPSRSSSP